jgi:DNA-binding CsgD family transcriptional regulator/tetratricopeptide (TPR) repeat protein
MDLQRLHSPFSVAVQETGFRCAGNCGPLGWAFAGARTSECANPRCHRHFAPTMTDTGRRALGEPGRSTEAHIVEDFLTSASSAPSALVIQGDPGIGKTTLWLSALDQARERGFAVLAARASATDSVLAYTSLADLLGDAGLDATPLPDPQRLAIDRILLRANTDGQPTDQRTVAAAFLSAIHILAETSPVLVAVDDLQWLDPSSAQAIGFAARRATGPVGLLATFRTNSHHDSAPSWFAPAPPADLTRIRLGPLSVGALHSAVSRRLGRSLSRPQMSRIYEVSAGNPFYAIELARALLDQPPGAHVSMPATLMELVHNRIGTLDPAVRQALLAMACVGAPTIGDIAYAIGSDTDHALGLLEAAETQGIIEISGNRVQFTHPLLARGCYDDATAAQRRAMHRRLAELVAEPELRARHLALSDTTGEPQTLEALDTAAHIARMRGAPAAAAELVELAIGLGGDTATRRILCATHHFNAGNAAHARTMLEQTLVSVATAKQRAEALNVLGLMSHLEGSVIEGADQLERALANAGDDLALRVQILVSLSWIQTHNADQLAASARNIADAVASAVRLNDTQLLSQALGMNVVVHLLLGNGLDDRNLCRALELENGRTATTVMFRPTVHDALASAWTGQLDVAHGKFVAIRKNCIDHGEESELVFVTFHQVLNEIWRGDLTEGAQLAEDTVDRARQLGGTLSLAAALTVRALVAAYGGREHEARRDLDEAIGPMRESGTELLTAWTVAVLGFLEVSLGDCQAAIDALEPLLARVGAAPNATEIFVAWFLPDAVESLIQSDRMDEAAPWVEILERNGRRLDRPWMLAVGARCRAMLLAAQGDLAAATEAAQAAMAEHDRLPMPFERARTQLLLGQLQRRQRHRDAARANLVAALTVFDELDTPLWSAKARTSLARSDITPGPAKLLTSGERRVAELAASGMTNREIAAALFISPKTVEVHLTRAYRKLDVRTRAELVRRIDQLDL